MKNLTFLVGSLAALSLAVVACSSAPPLEGEEAEATEAQAASQELSVMPPRRSCGGIAGIACPSGYTCVDDPTDSCDPAKGGADCGGICLPTRPPRCSPEKKYVSRSPSTCAAIHFLCEPGREPFFDPTGCGCRCASAPKPVCPVIDCAAPPPGCHYEGMVTTPCEKQTCGTLVCLDPLP